MKAKNIEAIIPDDADREFIHWTIFEELGRGIISANSKAKYISIINKLIQQGAQGVILGCTEIPLLIKEGDVSIPVFDTTKIHSDAAVRFCCQQASVAAESVSVRHVSVSVVSNW